MESDADLPRRGIYFPTPRWYEYRCGEGHVSMAVLGEPAPLRCPCCSDGERREAVAVVEIEQIPAQDENSVILPTPWADQSASNRSWWLAGLKVGALEVLGACAVEPYLDHEDIREDAVADVQEAMRAAAERPTADHLRDYWLRGYSAAARDALGSGVSEFRRDEDIPDNRHEAARSALHRVGPAASSDGWGAALHRAVIQVRGASDELDAISCPREGYEGLRIRGGMEGDAWGLLGTGTTPAPPTTPAPEPTAGPAAALRWLATDTPDLGWVSAAGLLDLIPESRWPDRGDHPEAILHRTLARLVRKGEWSAQQFSSDGGHIIATYRPGKERT